MVKKIEMNLNPEIKRKVTGEVFDTDFSAVGPS